MWLLDPEATLQLHGATQLCVIHIRYQYISQFIFLLLIGLVRILSCGFVVFNGTHGNNGEGNFFFCELFIPNQKNEHLQIVSASR